MPDITTFKFKSLVMILMFLSSCIAYARDGDQIDKNEKVIFFPSYGYFDSCKSQWALIIQGIIFQPSTSGFKRQLVTSGFEAYTGSTIFNRENFWERVQPLVSDNERGEKVKIQLGGKTYIMPESSNEGRFTEEIMLSSNEVQRLMDANGWIHYTATSEDNRTLLGKVQLTRPNGVSVISDVDDTIKVTEVYKDKKTMLINTFNRPTRAAPGMSAFYRELNNPDVRFHYVSGSPWQLYPVLEGFRADNGFPAGSFNMK